LTELRKYENKWPRRVVCCKCRQRGRLHWLWRLVF